MKLKEKLCRIQRKIYEDNRDKHDYFVYTYGLGNIRKLKTMHGKMVEVECSGLVDANLKLIAKSKKWVEK